ncbi:MAG: biotin--[acetyl-CoA-carboxylase] ligase [Syntrophorhabdaceae bacterium]|nr:biotin--[acetyl-CoA-carboxylase] ligase [Syntrophorhabdaceae bacterium]
MNKFKDIIEFLKNKDGYVSGELISSSLGISRTAVWKYVKHLDRLGYKIESSKGQGYRLIDSPDKLYPWEIKRYLTTSFIGKDIYFLETVDSTNTYAFKKAMDGASEGTCIVAESQSTGRGRLNRTWFSPAGKNLYLSVVLRPHSHPSMVYPITFISSLAVYDTVKEFTGIVPQLKWPNDVLIKGKKVSGTLLELSTEPDMVNFVVVGIGLNINTRQGEFDKEIRDKATSLYMETSRVFERCKVCASLLNHIERYYGIFREKGGEEVCAIWEERSGIKGKYVEINQMGEVYSGLVEGVDRSGAIILKGEDGKSIRVIAGDVSI